MSMVKCFSNTQAPRAAASEETEEPSPKERVGRGSLGAVVDLLAVFYRDLLALRLGGPDAAIIHEDRRDRLHALARQRPAERWMACLDSLLLARRRIDQNVSVPIVTDWLALKLVGAE